MHPHAVPITSWLQALTIFLSVGGFHAPFVINSDFIGVAVYKFRVLSRNLLKLCATSESQFDDFFLDREEYVKWIPSFPREPAFPNGIFFTPRWNLAYAIVRLSRLQVQISLQQAGNLQCTRIPLADYVDAVLKAFFLLSKDDLSSNWHIPNFRQKRRPPAWVRQFLQLRSDCHPMHHTTSAPEVGQF